MVDFNEWRTSTRFIFSCLGMLFLFLSQQPFCKHSEIVRNKMSKLLYILRDKLALWALVLFTIRPETIVISFHYTCFFSFVGDLCRVQDKSTGVVATNLSYLYNKSKKIRFFGIWLNRNELRISDKRRQQMQNDANLFCHNENISIVTQTFSWDEKLSLRSKCEKNG